MLKEYIDFLSETWLLQPFILMIGVSVCLQAFRFVKNALTEDEYDVRPTRVPYIVPPTRAAEIAVVESADEEIADAPQEAHCKYCGTKQSGSICTQCGAPL